MVLPLYSFTLPLALLSSYLYADTFFQDKDRPRRRRTRASSPRPHSAQSRESRHSRISTIAPILTSWPPPGLTIENSMSQSTAVKMLASGVPIFHGFRRPIPHASPEFQNYYATITSPWSSTKKKEDGEEAGDANMETVGESDRMPVWHPAFAACSFRLHGNGQERPWESLEQPNMVFYYGRSRGTTTLNNWVGRSAKPAPAIGVRDLGVRPREVPLAVVLERLIYLEGGFEEDYEELM